MEAKELRIGNRIVFGLLEVDMTVNMLIDIIDSHYKDQYRPIPLTEEWLIKFGAVKGHGMW